MKTLNTLLIMMMITLQSAAQEIAGRVLDDKKEPLISATVAVYQGHALKGGAVTDFDGYYSIKPLAPGFYDVQVTYTGYDPAMMTRITVKAGGKTTANFTLKCASNHLSVITVKAYKKPVIESSQPSKTVLTSEEIRTLPTTEVTDMASLSPALYQHQRGRGVPVGGARACGQLYIIDGVQVQNAGNTGMQIAQSAPAQFYNPSTAEYKKYAENDFRTVVANPLSTMSVDVDRASYTNIRRFINEGNKPPADAVRIEEMINYFEYQYPEPADNNPIAINTELTECPWRSEHRLLRIGIQAVHVDTSELPPSNLVFLIDVSGSMASAERLPLLIDGMKLLVKNLRANDTVSIVTYAGAAGLALPPTPGSNKQAILDALGRLQAGGSTAGGAGIMLAYKTAVEHFIRGGNNRVILATDGDFNVGISNDNDLEALIVKQRETGVFLTCLGFGTSNYKDAKMETLADKGNGNYHYIDNLKEAQKALVGEFGGTLFTVAKDVQAQIEFNPSIVQGYRLVGYENRILNEEDFKDDKKDAGDMGAGHTVTIIYEIIPAGIKSKYVRGTHKLKYREPAATEDRYNGELATVKFRYKHPDSRKSKEMTHPIANQVKEWDEISPDTKFATAVAMFGMLLKGSEFKGTTTYEDVIAIAKANKGSDKDGYRDELIKLVVAMKEYDSRTTAR